MKIILSFAVTLALLHPATAIAQDKAAPTPVERGEAFLRLLEKGSFDEAVKGFDATMAAALPKESLQTTWTGLMGQAGKLKTIDERRTKVDQGMTIVDLICTFEKAPLVCRVVYNAEGKVAGLWFKPASEAIPASK